MCPTRHWSHKQKTNAITMTISPSSVSLASILPETLRQAAAHLPFLQYNFLSPLHFSNSSRCCCLANLETPSLSGNVISSGETDLLLLLLFRSARGEATTQQVTCAAGRSMAGAMMTKRHLWTRWRSSILPHGNIFFTVDGQRRRNLCFCSLS